MSACFYLIQGEVAYEGYTELGAEADHDKAVAMYNKAVKNHLATPETRYDAHRYCAVRLCRIRVGLPLASDDLLVVLLKKETEY